VSVCPCLPRETKADVYKSPHQMRRVFLLGYILTMKVVFLYGYFISVIYAFWNMYCLGESILDFYGY
jgi:hypothetical protein